MTRLTIPSLVCAGAFTLFQLATIARSQVQPQATPQTVPSTEPTTPTLTPPTPPGIVPPSGMPSNVPNTRKVNDADFLREAVLGGLAEVELGKLASEKSSSDDVKKFAQKMTDYHAKVNDQVKQVARDEKIEVPAALDSKNQSRIDKLTQFSGPRFDKAYVKDQIKAHEEEVKHFDDEAQSGSRANVMGFASTIAPTLKQHLEMAKALKKPEKGRK